MPVISGISMSSNIRSKGLASTSSSAWRPLVGLGDVAKAEVVERADQREPHGAAVVHHQHGGLLERGGLASGGGGIARARRAASRLGFGIGSFIMGCVHAWWHRRGINGMIRPTFASNSSSRKGLVT